MKERNSAFALCHPLINFLFYAFAVVFSIILMHPVYLAISFLCAFSYAVMLKGRRVVKFTVFLGLPAVILVTVINALLNHNGDINTALFYIGDNPIVREAVYFGLASGIMLITVLLWFMSYNEIVSSDKFIYLFGRIIPKAALIISMTLRLVPKMKSQIKKIADAQNMIGKGLKGGGLLTKIKHGLRILSILITWSLENGIETSDSMRARGYGLKRRTSFTLYRFYTLDKIILPLLIAAVSLLITGLVLDLAFFQYYPYVKAGSYGAANICMIVLYAVTVSLPLIIETTEKIKWRLSISRI